MARWLVYLLVFSLAVFFVLSEEVAETSTESIHSGSTTIPTTSVHPTRTSSITSTKPPLVHNPLISTEAVPTTIPETKGNNSEQKSGARSLNTYIQLVVSFIGMFLCISAI